MLKLYNTLTRKKERLKTIEKDRFKIYTCGPTVYDYAHIGNLSAYLSSDLLKRYLTYLGYEVDDVMNITDVDDKTIKASRKSNKSLKEYTSFYTKALQKDLKKLNILEPKALCKATDYIEEMIDLVQVLIEKGYAYKAEDGSVYFRISSFKEYGKLTQIKKEKLMKNASARMNDDEYDKDDVCDFVLWKKRTAEDGDVYWNSPFGKGRPGWHIECSAMSMKHLGESLDIHTGGVDLMFPHHENEIAQSESATEKRFVGTWMHRGFLKVDGRKMSKSLGNVYKLNDVLKINSNPLAVRYLLLTTNYRSSINFTFDSLEYAQNSLNKIQEFIQRLLDIDREMKGSTNKVKGKINKAREDFKKAMNDDLNASEAIASLFKLIKEINSMIDGEEVSKNEAELTLDFLKEVNQVWGFLSFKRDTTSRSLKNEIEGLIEKRNKHRSNQEWEKADEVRKKLEKMGVEIKDTKEATNWSIRK